MRVAPILTTPAQRINFNGTFKVDHKKEPYDDHTQQVTVTEAFYTYYPDKGETEEQISKTISNFKNEGWDHRPYPSYSYLEIRNVNVYKPEK